MFPFQGLRYGGEIVVGLLNVVVFGVHSSIPGGWIWKYTYAHFPKLTTIFLLKKPCWECDPGSSSLAKMRSGMACPHWQQSLVPQQQPQQQWHPWMPWDFFEAAINSKSRKSYGCVRKFRCQQSVLHGGYDSEVCFEVCFGGMIRGMIRPTFFTVYINTISYIKGVVF